MAITYVSLANEGLGGCGQVMTHRCHTPSNGVSPFPQLRGGEGEGPTPKRRSYPPRWPEPSRSHPSNCACSARRERMGPLSSRSGTSCQWPTGKHLRQAAFNLLNASFAHRPEPGEETSRNAEDLHTGGRAAPTGPRDWVAGAKGCYLLTVNRHPSGKLSVPTA